MTKYKSPKQIPVSIYFLGELVNLRSYIYLFLLSFARNGYPLHFVLPFLSSFYLFVH